MVHWPLHADGLPAAWTVLSRTDSRAAATAVPGVCHAGTRRRSRELRRDRSTLSASHCWVSRLRSARTPSETRLSRPGIARRSAAACRGGCRTEGLAWADVPQVTREKAGTGTPSLDPRAFGVRLPRVPFEGIYATASAHCDSEASRLEAVQSRGCAEHPDSEPPGCPSCVLV